MLFVIGFTLSLLTVAAGLFLLAKSKDGLGKFFKVMAWIIIALGIVAILATAHCGIHRLMSMRHGCCMHDRNEVMFDKNGPPCGGPCFDDFCKKDGKCKDVCDGNSKVKVIVIKGDDKDFDGYKDVEKIIKIVTDSTKTSP